LAQLTNFQLGETHFNLETISKTGFFFSLSLSLWNKRFDYNQQCYQCFVMVKHWGKKVKFFFLHKISQLRTTKLTMKRSFQLFVVLSLFIVSLCADADSSSESNVNVNVEKCASRQNAFCSMILMFLFCFFKPHILCLIRLFINFMIILNWNMFFFRLQNTNFQKNDFFDFKIQVIIGIDFLIHFYHCWYISKTDYSSLFWLFQRVVWNVFFDVTQHQ
jgi:hypothetical protein